MENKVLIGVPTAEFARQASFYDFFNQLDKPVGTIITFVHGQSPARNRNVIIEQALENECSHILFLDDDLALPPDLLSRLIRHDLDIVSGLYLMRNYPHQPIIFTHADTNGKCLHFYPKDDETGLIEIVSAGFGSLLVKTKVFLKMDKPWVTLGEIEPDSWCDDISFCNRARKAGFKIYCDLSAMIGHMASVTIRPEYQDGQWVTSYDTNGAGRVSFPSVKPNWEEYNEAVSKLVGV